MVNHVLITWLAHVPLMQVEVCMVSLSSPEKMLELQQAVDQHKPK